MATGRSDDELIQSDNKMRKNWDKKWKILNWMEHDCLVTKHDAGANDNIYDCVVQHDADTNDNIHQ